MKANRKFILHADDAVSPVIAVILMVAITVVLAATVYVWVSGFSSSGTQAKTISFSSSTANGAGVLTVISVAPNTNWNKIKITTDGIASGTYGIFVKAGSCSSFIDSTTATTWDGNSRLSSTTCPAGPGDIVRIGASVANGALKLNIVDTASNTVMATINVPSLSAIAATTTPAFNSCTGTTATFAAPYYSKTTADSAAIASADVTRTGAGLTTFTHSAGATTATIDTVSSANTYAAGSGKLWDIAGAAVGTTARTCT